MCGNPSSHSRTCSAARCQTCKHPAKQHRALCLALAPHHCNPPRPASTIHAALRPHPPSTNTAPANLTLSCFAPSSSFRMPSSVTRRQWLQLRCCSVGTWVASTARPASSTCKQHQFVSTGVDHSATCAGIRLTCPRRLDHPGTPCSC